MRGREGDGKREKKREKEGMEREVMERERGLKYEALINPSKEDRKPDSHRGEKVRQKGRGDTVQFNSVQFSSIQFYSIKFSSVQFSSV